MFLTFKKQLKNVQTADYNGAHMDQDKRPWTLDGPIISCMTRQAKYPRLKISRKSSL